jgi:hypothetical protein
MKNIFSLFLSVLLLSSCVDVYGAEDDPEIFGFHFRITNYTSVTYTNAEITTGTIEEGEFRASETLKSSTISRRGQAVENGSTSCFLFDDRWQPGLALIEKAYFKIKSGKK